MGCSNVQNFSTRSYFWEKRLSSKTFNGPWPPNSLVWWPKIYISIEGYSRPFQRCMTLHISMLYMVGRASERSFQKWVFLWTTKFWTCWCCFRRLEAVQNIFFGVRCSFGHPMEGFQSFFPNFVTHQILLCTPKLKRPERYFVSNNLTLIFNMER